MRVNRYNIGDRVLVDGVQLDLPCGGYLATVLRLPDANGGCPDCYAVRLVEPHEGAEETLYVDERGMLGLLPHSTDPIHVEAFLQRENVPAMRQPTPPF